MLINIHHHVIISTIQYYNDSGGYMPTPNLASFEVGEILEVKTEPTNTRNQFSQMTALIR